MRMNEQSCLVRFSEWKSVTSHSQQPSVTVKRNNKQVKSVFRRLVLPTLLASFSIPAFCGNTIGNAIDVAPPSGDPSADNTSVQAAISAASSSTLIRFKAGTYVLSQSINLKDGMILRGMGRGVTTLQIASDSYLKDLIVASGTTPISNAAVENMTLDGNRLGNPSGNQCLVYTSGANAVRYFALRGLTIKNSRQVATSLGTGLVQQTPSARGISITDSIFTQNGSSAIELKDAVGVVITGNTFDDNNQVDPGVPIIALHEGPNHVAENVTITGNNFYANIGSQYAIEGRATNSTPIPKNVTVSGNTFQGSGNGGIGVSLQGNNLVVSGNTFTGGNSNQRSGIEMGGSYLVASGNLMNPGKIVVSPTTFLVSDNAIISNNQIMGSVSGGTQGLSAIMLRGVTHANITGNIIEMRVSNGGPIDSGIALNFYGSAFTPSSKITIANNQLRAMDDTSASYAHVGNGIRSINNSTSNGTPDTIDQVTITNNLIEGFYNGISLPSDDTVTNTRITRNIFVSNTTDIAGNPTGAGNFINTDP